MPSFAWVTSTSLFQTYLPRQIPILMSLLYHNDTITKKEKELLRALLIQFCKLEVDYQLIIKNIIPKIANPSQIATILKFFELIFPFLYSSWHK